MEVEPARLEMEGGRRVEEKREKERKSVWAEEDGRRAGEHKKQTTDQQTSHQRPGFAVCRGDIVGDQLSGCRVGRVTTSKQVPGCLSCGVVCLLGKQRQGTLATGMTTHACRCCPSPRSLLRPLKASRPGRRAGAQQEWPVLHQAVQYGTRSRTVY